MTLPTTLPSSTGTRHRTHTVLIDQDSFGLRSIDSSTHLLLKLLLIYGSVFVSSSLRLPPSVHVNQSLPPVSFHAAVCCQDTGSYMVPGATLLGAVLIWYTVNRLLQQISKPCYTSRFRFTALSLSSCIILQILTSSTAQGGGGSFKNKKPIGEIGCCESGMAERSH